MSSPALEGWLEKKGEKGVLWNWRKRYFRLVEPKLYYFKTANDNTPLGFIPVDQVISVHPTLDGEKEGFPFQINTPGRTYFLFTESDDQFNYWLMGLIKLIKRLGTEEKFYNTNPSPASNLPKKNTQIPEERPSSEPPIPVSEDKKALRSTSHKSLSSMNETITLKSRSPTITPTSSMAPINVPSKPLPRPPGSPTVEKPSSLPSRPSNAADNVFLNRNTFVKRDTPFPPNQTVYFKGTAVPPGVNPSGSSSPNLTRNFDNNNSNNSNNSNPVSIPQTKPTPTPTPTQPNSPSRSLPTPPSSTSNNTINTTNNNANTNANANNNNDSLKTPLNNNEDDDDGSLSLSDTDSYDTDDEDDGDDVGEEVIGEDGDEEVKKETESTGRTSNRNPQWAKSAAIISRGEGKNVFLSLRTRPNSESNNEQKRERQRTKVAVEVLETEESYVTCIELLVNNYLGGMRSARDKRTVNSLAIIFSNIEAILPLNHEILSLLKGRLSNWSNVQLLGDIFIKMGPFLKLYSAYGNNYENAINTYQKEMKENLYFKELVEKLDAQTNRNTRLHHLLIMPIQRIPRYNMLLSEIIKYTDPSHPDYNNLNLALKNMKGVADHINESVRVSERDRKIEMLHDRMEIINLLAPHRHLILETVVSLKNKKGKLGRRQLLLFNDIFVHVSRSRLKRAIEFTKPENNWPLSLVWISDQNCNDNQLIIMGPVRKMFISFESADEANEWKNSFKKALNDYLAGNSNNNNNNNNNNFNSNNNNNNSNNNNNDLSIRNAEFLFPDLSHYVGSWCDGQKKKQGIGKLKFFGSVYEGSFAANQMDGEGKLTYFTGDVFEGKWSVNNLCSGTITYSHGDKYVGEWKNSLKWGEGTFTYHNGDVYTGSWQNDLPHGKGKIVYTSGIRYTGEFQRGLRHGSGLFEYGNGATYDGGWQYGKRHGYGNLVNVDGSYYEGDFVNDEFEGKGVLVYKNARKYSGNWKAGKRSGNGVYSSAVGMVRSFDGEWVYDAFNGKGTLVFSNDDKYEGYFKDFKMHGSGVYTYSKSSVTLEGKWNMGIREGKFIIKHGQKVLVGFAKDNIIIIPGYETDLPFLPPPPYFEIDLE